MDQEKRTKTGNYALITAEFWLEGIGHIASKEEGCAAVTHPEDQHVIVGTPSVPPFRAEHVDPDRRIDVDRLAGGRGGELDVLLADGRQGLLVGGCSVRISRIIEIEQPRIERGLLDSHRYGPHHHDWRQLHPTK